MRIIRMTASFGRLQNAALELSPGLNLIEAPNEGGKSTWCAFIRAMLYGIPTRERDTKTSIAEKNRYQPWSGGAMEGAMELSWQGKHITLRRGPKGSTPFGSFSAVYTDTGEAVAGLTAENCGETLLGVSREVFERSAFVGQGGASIGESAELERRIAALVSSGEEDVSYSEVDARLREWLRRRRHNKSGLIPKLENELAVLDDTLARQAQARNQAEDAQREIAALTARRDALAAALSAWRSQANQARIRQYEAAQADLEAAQAAVDAITADLTKHGAPPDRETLRQAQEDLAYLKTVNANLKLAEGQVEEARAKADKARADAVDPLFPGLSADEAWRRASADASAVAACRSGADKQKKWRWLGLLIGLILGGAVAGLGPLIQPNSIFVFAGAGAGLLVLTEVLCVTVSSSRAKSLERTADGLLARYAAEYPDDILSNANAFREKCVLASEAERKAQAVEDSRLQLTAQREELAGCLLDLVHTFEPGVTDTFGVSAAISRALSLDERLATARVRLEGARKLAESLPRPDEAGDSAAGAADGGAPDEHFDPQAVSASLSAAEGELSRLRSTLAMARGELNTLGDPALFQARREELTEELSRRREEYDALTLALEGLADANSDLQARFSPALNAEAGDILSVLTGGKYGKVTLNREFEAMAEEADSPLPRRTLLLSQGTAEQVYLAVRLAVCRLALPGDECAPIVLDDALDAFDDARMALALDYLRTLGRERQVLLFTCHSREAAYLSGADDAAVTLHTLCGGS